MRDGVEGLEEVDRAGVLEDEERPQHQADVADDVDHERLEAGPGGGDAPVPERDQQVRGRAHERPPDDQQQEVAGQDQQQHREDEVVQVGEVADVAAVLPHVGDRVQVDQRGDAGDDQGHEDRQRVDEDRELGVDAEAEHVVPQRRGELTMFGTAPQQRHQRRHRERERQRDGQRCHPPGAAADEPPVTERDHRRAHERAQQDQPPIRRRTHSAHPLSSCSWSTSIGRWRR